MENREIAEIFSQVADILELADENVFKVRAYRTAAANILSLSRQLGDIYQEDPSKIEDIPGIGRDLKEKIIEMLSTGRLERHRELLKEFPKVFLDLLNISGLGPKKLKKLKDQLGVKNLADLEKSCKSGKIADMEGMGEKTQERLLDAIGYYRKQAGRMLLVDAYDNAVRVMNYLGGLKIVKKMEAAGSLRRGQETIGDIDILVVSDDRDKVMGHFTKYPAVESVIAKGPTKSSVLLRSGVHVDLRVIDESSFGAALVYFTGSKDHNVKLRKIAKKKGYKVSEYGVFKVNPSTGKEVSVAGRTERDVYKVLGMEEIPPELREDLGEIEAAMRGGLPRSLIQLKHIKGDLHVHSAATDGHNTIKEMAEKAKENGCEYIAITDHSKLIRVANGMDEKTLMKHIEAIKKIDKGMKGIKILAGVEVDVLEDGKLDLEDYVLKELDIVIASVHSHFLLDKKKQTARVLKAMENKYVNMLAHPTGRLISKRSPIEIDLDKVFTFARDANIYLEINTHGKRIDLNDAHCRRAKELGAKFAINTDAHEVKQLDQMIYGVIAARRGWVEVKDVLNTRSLEGFKKAIKR